MKTFKKTFKDGTVVEWTPLYLSNTLYDGYTAYFDSEDDCPLYYDTWNGRNELEEFPAQHEGNVYFAKQIDVDQNFKRSATRGIPARMQGQYKIYKN